MTHETSKACIRRSHDSRFATRYFVGDVIDIGSGDDSLEKYTHMFPNIEQAYSWDVANGDAMLMSGVPDNRYDCVSSSHCLEHLQDPFFAMQNWIRICRPGGYLVIVVPDFIQYEQGFWPSRFNADHKWSFSVSGERMHDRHIILLDSPELFTGVDVTKLECVERGFNHDAPLHDQSLSAACEPAIEIIARKRQI